MQTTGARPSGRRLAEMPEVERTVILLAYQEELSQIGDRRTAGMAARDGQDPDPAGAPPAARGARHRVRAGKPDSMSAGHRRRRSIRNTMDHDAIREQLELAAVEPGGLERLMAGDTATAQAVAAHLAGCPACTEELARLQRVAPSSCATRPRDALARPEGPDAGRDPCRGRHAAARRRAGRAAAVARSAPSLPRREPRRRSPSRHHCPAGTIDRRRASCRSSAGSRRSPPPSCCRSSARRPDRRIAGRRRSSRPIGRRSRPSRRSPRPR